GVCCCDMRFCKVVSSRYVWFVVKFRLCVMYTLVLYLLIKECSGVDSQILLKSSTRRHTR
ncbi:hypothetical protein, partial [Clostridioides difficile]|uniref:hypothetical protein n=1 Tax=Clostridioides difficile TaxID=1496 RepID=UPI001A9A644D